MFDESTSLIIQYEINVEKKQLVWFVGNRFRPGNG